MRFLCDQCKAKYQISDDKIAGKTVRMKCRKCGHMIEVRAEVTETSVASAAPAAATAGKAGAVSVGTPKPAGTRPAPPRKLATSLTSSGPARTPAPGTHPSALAGAFQRNVAANPSGSVRPPPGAPDDSSALDLLSASANPWYVAINGVPVGPVRLSEIRKKAASGLVTETSLVWQEGLEEWRQVKTFPELASIVREAAATGRPSLVSPPPDGRASMAPRPSAAAPRNNVVPIASRRVAESLSDDDFEIAESDATRVDMVAGNLAAEAAAQAGTASSLVAADPFAAASPQAAHAPQMARPAAAPAVFAPAAQAAGPFANPFAPTVQATSQASMASPLSIAPPEPRRREVNYFGIAMIGFAMAFGIAGAVVGVPLYFRAKAAAPGASASAVASAAAPSASIAASDLPPVGTEPVDSAAPVASGEKVASSGGHASGGRPASTAGGAKASDPSIADLLRGGGGGPTVGGGSGPSAGGGTSALSTSEIEGVVNNRKTGITRTCWERNNSNLSNANVTCHITIAANGTVSSSQADGSDPVVAKCIEQQVKGWTFPPSSGSTRVDLPFHFVRQ